MVSEKKVFDYLIVGGGLAGSVLAFQLDQLGKRILLIGNTYNHSSAIAAGLFNPITGKVLSKTWQAQNIFTTLHHFYLKAEKVTGQHFFHPMPIYRPFLSVEEQNEWMGKSASADWAVFIEKIFTRSAGWKGVEDAFGGLLLKQTGFLNTVGFMEAIKNYFIQKQQFLERSLAFDKLEITSNSIVFEEYQSDKIIFCEGTHALQNPYFNWLPIRILKGETLTVETPLPEDVIVNRGIYGVPVKEGVFKLGATYETQDLSPNTTAKGLQELEEKFKEIISLPNRVVNQEWGYRPTTPDRRPMIGEHPEYKNVMVCNGLGTKGVSLAPFVANLMAEFLVNGIRSATYDAVDVSRYYSLYWKAVHKR
jgi:glycine/D-amino acid oxidase-like deaminating enzyme